jgi:tRNA pseudouridine55 synthase
MEPAEDIPPSSFDFIGGELLLINKPKGWTSFDVVNKVRNKLRYLTGVKNIKVGHAGTLDPMATGLLIVCTGKMTRQIDEFQQQHKTYTGTITLGAVTPSFDAETEVEEIFPTDHITEQLIHDTCQVFTGALEQVPPMFSAIKVDGQPLYKRARKGEFIAIQPRPVHIYSFKITRINMPELDFEVNCSKGTYIRSLANDFGKQMGSGAYLSALCRTKIGDYSVENSWDLDQLIAAL